jgi:hypothetical protein
MKFRPTEPDDRAIAILWAIAASCAIALAPIAPLLARMAPTCPVHAFTGVPCPSCGATRAALSLAGGQVLVALESNPLATLAMAFGVAGGLAAPLWVGAGMPTPVLDPGRRLRVLIAATLAINWIYLVVRGV